MTDQQFSPSELAAALAKIRDYPATLALHHDGDTCHAVLVLNESFGFVSAYGTLIRYAGINAPELATPAGKIALEFVAAKLPAGSTFTFRSPNDEREKYGRALGWLILADGMCLNRLLVDSGNAVPYGDLPVDPPTPT